MKFCEDSPHQGLSAERQGSAVISHILFLSLAAGAPSRGNGINQREKCGTNSHIISGFSDIHRPAANAGLCLLLVKIMVIR